MPSVDCDVTAPLSPVPIALAAKMERSMMDRAAIRGPAGEVRRESAMRNGVRRLAGTLALFAACLQFGPALAQSKPSEIKIAVVQFLSGAAAPHDASAVNTARLLTEQFNASGGIEGVRLNTHVRRRSRLRGRQSCGVPPPRPGREDHHCDRLYVECQLSRCRPRRRRAQDADYLPRVRQLSAVRQGNLQVRIPHRRACGIREYQRGALRSRRQAQSSRPLRA